jgi:hypothetical protein
VAALFRSSRAQRPAHGKGRREAWQHDTENVVRQRKRVRHGGRFRRRNGATALTRGDGGELEQRRWHAASDRGGDATLRHGGEAVRCRTAAVGQAREARQRSASDKRVPTAALTLVDARGQAAWRARTR